MIELKAEIETFETERDNLVKSGNTGKFVVIKGSEIFDVFNTYEDALRQGLKKYGNVPFLVKEVAAFEQINFFFHGVEIPCQVSA